jgi:tRNA(fMet)-specific endonuclease VapC
MTVPLHLLDTDIASFILRGRARVLADKLAALPPDRVCVSAITRGELMYGLKRLDPNHRLHILVRQFFQIVRVLAWGAEAADYYADIRHRLTTTGRPIGELDMMIAAHALAAGAILVTNNTRHFVRLVPPLTLVNWLES